MQNGLPTKANLYHRRSSIKIPNFNADARVVCCQEGDGMKCYRLFRPKFSKVKTSFVAQIRQVSNTLTPSAGVCDYTPV